MTTIEMTGVDRDAEGFLTDPQQWNEDIAAMIASERWSRSCGRGWMPLTVSGMALATGPRAKTLSAGNRRLAPCRSLSASAKS
mgnify:CR=1 FL=1